MKKSEMQTANLKTAQLHRLLRKWHIKCVAEGSKLWIGFDPDLKEHMATCSNCLIGRSVDDGKTAATLQQMRGRN